MSNNKRLFIGEFFAVSGIGEQTYCLYRSYASIIYIIRYLDECTWTSDCHLAKCPRISKGSGTLMTSIYKDNAFHVTRTCPMRTLIWKASQILVPHSWFLWTALGRVPLSGTWPLSGSPYCILCEWSLLKKQRFCNTRNSNYLGHLWLCYIKVILHYKQHKITL